MSKTNYEAFIGIDFGTSNSAIAYALLSTRDKPRVSNHYIPTAVYHGVNKQWYVGDGALQRGVNDQRYLFTNFKLNLTTNKTYETQDSSTITARKLAQKVIQELVDDAVSRDFDLSRTSIVATHPVGEHWQQIIKNVYTEMQLTGELIMLPEPEAALYYAHHIHNILTERPRLALLIDFGGGTCDFLLMTVRRDIISILKAPEITVKKQSSNNQLGGSQIDRLIVQKLIEKFGLDENTLLQLENEHPAHARNLLSDVKDAKENLSRHFNSNSAHTDIEQPLFRLLKEDGTGIDYRDDITFSAEELRTWTYPFIYELFRKELVDGNNGKAPLLGEEGLQREDISMIMLTGGSSQFDWISTDILPELFPHLGRDNIYQLENAHLSVVTGAAIYAHDKYLGKNPLKRTTLSSLKVIFSDGEEEILVPKGATLPIDIKKPFRLKEPRKNITFTLAITDSDDNYESRRQPRTIDFGSTLPVGTKMYWIITLDVWGDVTINLVETSKPNARPPISFNKLQLNWKSRD